MNIFYQTPNAGSPQLLTKLSEAAAGATSAGAAFAFASKDGVDLLFAQPAICGFATAAAFDLVVGLDAITDTRALEALERAAARFPHLSVSLFLNPRPGRTFHPKAIWFRSAQGGVTITGSGNLTKGGLLRNWEAFSREACDAAVIAAVAGQWNQWKVDHGGALRGLADQEARQRAARNRLIAAAVQKATKLPPAAAAQLLATIVAPVAADDAPFFATELVANRPTQPNINKSDFEDFFGVPPAAGKQLTLYRVYPNGAFSEPHTTPTIRTSSGNFRFNLKAMHGVVYPAGDRPVALFERLDEDNFKYLVLLPGDPGYAPMQAHLNGPSPPGALRLRIRLSLDDLEQVWPDCPLLSSPTAD